MKSSLITFIERYRDITMRHDKLKMLWKTIDKSDFDNNEQEVFEWFQELRKKRQSDIKNGLKDCHRKTDTFGSKSRKLSLIK